MTLDITMPEKDGLEALGEIISIDPGARVLMCSALGQEAKVIESIQKGAKDFVVKPFQPAAAARGGRQGAGLRRGREAPPTISISPPEVVATGGGLRAAARFAF